MHSLLAIIILLIGLRTRRKNEIECLKQRSPRVHQNVVLNSYTLKIVRSKYCLTAVDIEYSTSNAFRNPKQYFNKTSKNVEMKTHTNLSLACHHLR